MVQYELINSCLEINTRMKRNAGVFKKDGREELLKLKILEPIFKYSSINITNFHEFPFAVEMSLLSLEFVNTRRGGDSGVGGGKKK